MIILDEQLSPHLAKWLTDTFEVDAFSTSFLKLTTSLDLEIFNFAKEKNAIVITKDDDFIKLLAIYGPPPKIIWITCGNTTNDNLKKILRQSFLNALNILETEVLVEITT